MNVMTQQYEQYKKQGVMMASPMALIIMLYNGCIKKLKQAQDAIGKRDFCAANTHLQRSQDIIMELITSLDLHYPISKDLMSLYEYIYRRLIEINISKSAEEIVPIIEILSSLRDTWTKVEKENRSLMSYEIDEGEA